jgi:site-specific recombinase XerD
MTFLSITTGRGIEMPRNTPTVLVCLEHYLESRRGDWATNTMNNNRSQLLQLVAGVGKDRYGHDRPLGNVTPFQVEKWFVTVVSDKNPSPQSFNKVRTMVSQFLKYCTAHSWVTKDLTQDVHKRRLMFTEKMQLSGPELVAILEVCKEPRDRGLMAMGINTGLRSSEITGIKIKDVDFDEQEVYVVRTKSYRDDRIGMTKALEKELRVWLTHYANAIDQPLDDEMYLFRLGLDRGWLAAVNLVAIGCSSWATCCPTSG